MKTSTFTKKDINQDFDHQLEVKEMFSALGFADVKVNSCYTNGASHYVNVNLQVVDPMKIYAEMFVFEGLTSAKVRISDHRSNLDTLCGGVSGNEMNFASFKNLIDTGAVKPS